MNSGLLCFVLHAHLPFVHHPEYDSFFEENWLFEAITECYLPLLAVLDRLERDKVKCRLTVSLSPTLTAMLDNALLRQRYLRHLERLIELADKEVERTRGQAEFHALALAYQQGFRTAWDSYRNRYQQDLLAGFLHHFRGGRLELITCAATHGLLPLLNVDPVAVRQQVFLGVHAFQSRFGVAPKGFWLPECGYYPGLEQVLHEAGVEYFFVDSHGLLAANPCPGSGVYAPVDCGNGVQAFGRDPDCSRQVWSAQTGYPGDANYREYYRDIGFDLPLDYIGPYILDGATRIDTGIKYYAVSEAGAQKRPYRPDAASRQAQRHAEDFTLKRQRQAAALQAEMPTAPIMVAPYDAELFGHWWYEGPQWLEAVLRLAAAEASGIETVTGGDYLARYPHAFKAVPAASTWGDRGYSEYWLNDSNEWIYPLLHKASADMAKLVGDLARLQVNELQQRALNQALRSLLLAQASDWPFIMKSGTTEDYARKRVSDHLARFNYLHDCLRKNRIDERYLSALEIMDDIFPTIDFRDYRSAD
ncbi:MULTISPECIES: glycoside hydrolase family 57 protein [Methylomonas]|uniref:glycoside hydrolase family 57 protein n=1 Tax=Methylomonas TaxID=416 RepID=UPI001232C9A2|nr:1,4-alpha-glucan branching protein domain-containing protein [Methylomonas rhizoryzae]